MYTLYSVLFNYKAKNPKISNYLKLCIKGIFHEITQLVFAGRGALQPPHGAPVMGRAHGGDRPTGDIHSWRRCHIRRRAGTYRDLYVHQLPPTPSGRITRTGRMCCGSMGRATP